MDAIEFESLILSEAIECLAEHAIEYAIDQFAAAFDDRGDEYGESVRAADAGPAAGFKTWEELIGYDAHDELVSSESWPHGGAAKSGDVL